MLAGLLLAAFAATASDANAQRGCGERHLLRADDGQTIAYSLAAPTGPERYAALVLLVGGGGVLDLDLRGCPRKLAGNSLVRQRTIFLDAGFATALVDAPSGWRGTDGLAGRRATAPHAAELGLVIADVRRRTGLPVYVVGTSRGAISATNAASRLAGPAAPDGLVLTSPLTVGTPGGAKAWTSQSVFDLPLEAVRVPVLVVVHGADTCFRTPPALAANILARTNGSREQFVRVEGGPRPVVPPDRLAACHGRTPHQFIGQEAEVAAGIARFVRGGAY